MLGDGFQRKSYMHVADCVRALVALQVAKPCNVINLGQDQECTVRDSISWIIDEMKVSPHIFYGDGSKGWVGDNPRILLDCSKAQSLGWTPKFKIEVAVRETVKWLLSSKVHL